MMLVVVKKVTVEMKVDKVLEGLKVTLADGYVYILYIPVVFLIFYPFLAPTHRDPLETQENQAIVVVKVIQ